KAYMCSRSYLIMQRTYDFWEDIDLHVVKKYLTSIFNGLGHLVASSWSDGFTADISYPEITKIEYQVNDCGKSKPGSSQFRKLTFSVSKFGMSLCTSIIPLRICSIAANNECVGVFNIYAPKKNDFYGLRMAKKLGAEIVPHVSVRRQYLDEALAQGRLIKLIRDIRLDIAQRWLKNI
ncbi:hypothetical protein WA026_015924, partial [Henosepilachna vigintioctopunctata]